MQSNNHSRLRLAAWLSALFLVVLGAKLWVIRLYGSAVPFWDQWDEARLLFKPWLEGQWTWSMWFGPHNEHRIFFTRLLDVFLLWLNRQWDPILQMSVNAVIHTGYACGLAYALWTFTGRKNAGLICSLLMPFFALPFAAENTLHAFQSQMYFLGIFSLATMVGLGFSQPWSLWWWCGWAAAVLSLFTMGSGLLAVVAVLGLLGLRVLKQKNITRDQWWIAGGCVVIFLLGLALDATMGRHQLYKIRPYWTFGEALLDNLAWPFGNQPVMLWIVGLPLILTAVRYFRPDFKNPRAAEFVLVLGFWDFLQSAALAYARAHLGSSSRYMDTLDTFALASLASLFIPGTPSDYRRLSQPFRQLLAVVWTVWLFWGIWQISQGVMGTGNENTKGHYMQSNRQWTLREETNIRAYISTDDLSHLSDQPSLAIPYPDATGLANLLRDPKLQGIMPPACRPPLKLEIDEASDAVFVANGYPPEMPAQSFTRAWGNYSTNGAVTAGAFISRPLSATLPRLILSLCCGTSWDGIRIQLVEESTGRTSELHPQIVGRWHTLIVTTPRSPFRLKITDTNLHSWVAMGDIQELGHFSYYALLLLDHAATVLLAGLGLCVLFASAAVIRRGIGFAGGALAELLVALTALIVLAYVWRGRNFDAAQLNVKLHQTWARGFTLVGDLPEAEMHLREVLWLRPRDSETLVALANTLLADSSLDKERSREQAVVYYKAALKVKPDYLQARQRLDQILQEPTRRDTTPR